MPAENWHFTLRFLGEMDAAHEHEAAAACLAATADFATFPLAIGGFGAFPNLRRPRSPCPRVGR